MPCSAAIFYALASHERIAESKGLFVATAAGNTVVDAQLFVVKQHPAQGCFGIADGKAGSIVFADVRRHGLAGIIIEIGQIDSAGKSGCNGWVGFGDAAAGSCGVFFTSQQAAAYKGSGSHEAGGSSNHKRHRRAR